MNHISLFSGIGGFDLASEKAGWKNVATCEVDPFCRKILKYYWPYAIHYEDIKQTDFTIHRGAIDVLTGGFPCQPYSTAGKRLGTADARHLWPEMLRAIREIQPRWVVGENVRGIVSWNGGLVFDEVQSDLEAAGYEVLPFILPACAVGAPHRRDRVWFVAYCKSAKRQCAGNTWAGRDGLTDLCAKAASYSKSGYEREYSGNQKDRQAQQPGNSIEQAVTSDAYKQRREERGQAGGWQDSAQDQPGLHGGTERLGDNGATSYPDGSGRQEQHLSAKSSGAEQFARPDRWDNFPTTQPTIRGGNDGLSGGLDGITFSKHRRESIKAYGNAIVPQVAYEIFKAINLYEKMRY